jgi:hypothetical protein
MNQGVIQIGTGAPTTLKQAATIVGNLSTSLLNKPLAPTFDATKPEGDRGRIAVTELAESILGWSAKVNVEEGLKRTFQWVMADMAKKKAASAAPKEVSRASRGSSSASHPLTRALSCRLYSSISSPRCSLGSTRRKPTRYLITCDRVRT